MAKITMMLAKKLAADELNDTATVLPLDNLDASIVQADALFSEWPRADAVIGNPPFLGRRKMVEELGVSYTLSRSFPAVGGVSDFVAYWFPIAHNHIAAGARAGLVATNSIRQNETRRASLDYIEDHDGVITEAVSSKPWSGEANVFVSIINWMKTDASHPAPEERVLWVNDGEGRLVVTKIPTSLSPNVDVRSAKPLPFNQTPPNASRGRHRE